MLRGCHSCNCKLHAPPGEQFWAPRSAPSYLFLKEFRLRTRLLPPHLPDLGPLLGLSPQPGDRRGGWVGTPADSVPQQGHPARTGPHSPRPRARGPAAGPRAGAAASRPAGEVGVGAGGAEQAPPQRSPGLRGRSGGRAGRLPPSRPAQVTGDRGVGREGSPDPASAAAPLTAREESNSFQGFGGKRGQLKALPC